MRTAVALPMATENIGQLGARLSFSCRPRMGERQQRRRLLVWQSQKIQRIRRGDEFVLTDLQVALRALKRVVAEQRLNGHQIHPGF